MSNFWKRIFGMQQAQTTTEKRRPNVLVMVRWDDCAGNDDIISRMQEKGVAVATEMVDNPDFRIAKVDAVILSEFKKRRVPDATFLDKVIFIEKDEQLRARGVERHFNLIVGVQDLQEAIEIIEKL